MSRVAGNVPMKKMVAARDVGDVRGDRERKARLAAIIAKATCLLEEMPSGAFPEVEDAAKTARGAAELLKQFETTSNALKANPSGTTEAAEAQILLNNMRVSFDAMLTPLEATMNSMVTLMQQSMAIEAKYQELQTQVQLLEESLKREKTRLGAAAQAVKNATQIG